VSQTGMTGFSKV